MYYYWITLWSEYINKKTIKMAVWIFLNVSYYRELINWISAPLKLASPFLQFKSSYGTVRTRCTVWHRTLCFSLGLRASVTFVHDSRLAVRIPKYYARRCLAQCQTPSKRRKDVGRTVRPSLRWSVTQILSCVAVWQPTAIVSTTSVPHNSFAMSHARALLWMLFYIHL